MARTRSSRKRVAPLTAPADAVRTLRRAKAELAAAGGDRLGAQQAAEKVWLAAVQTARASLACIGVKPSARGPENLRLVLPRGPMDPDDPRVTLYHLLSSVRDNQHGYRFCDGQGWSRREVQAGIVAVTKAIAIADGMCRRRR